MENELHIINKHNKPTVNLGMSGGVDSSVAAILLQKAGYNVKGITFELCGSHESSKQSLALASEVAKDVGIEWKSINLRDEFAVNVMDNFVEAYENACTPNPCVICNRKIKFKYLIKPSAEDCKEPDYIATGHYAKIEYCEKTGRWLLKKADNQNKDQSYFLYYLTQDVLQKCIFPLSSYSKDEIRDIASKNGLSIANKKDSQDVCFVPDGDYAAFISEYANARKGFAPGNFEDLDGHILGQHKGLIHYTIGQRKGLGLALKAPMYVHHLDVERNAVVLGSDLDLFSNKLIVKDFNWVSCEKPSAPFRAKARIRYRHKEADCTVYPDEIVKIIFDAPQRAITPGQSCVVYQDDIVLGGGIIVK